MNVGGIIGGCLLILLASLMIWDVKRLDKQEEVMKAQAAAEGCRFVQRRGSSKMFYAECNGKVELRALPD